MTVAGRVATNPVGAELARSRAEHAVPLPDRLARRVVIDNVRPCVDEGRFPIKRTVGESVEVIADIFADGHDVVVARLRRRKATAEHAEIAEPEFSAHSASSAVALSTRDEWLESPMTLVSPGTDEWRGVVDVDDVGWHEFLVVAWVDRFRSWRRDLQIKAAAGQDLGVELLEGSLLIREAAERAGAERGAESPALQGTTVARPFQGRDHDAGWLLSQADALSE